MAVKRTSLRKYFTLYGIRLCLLPFVIALAAFGLFLFGVYTNVLHRANYIERQIAEQKTVIAQADMITSEMMPEGTRYILIEKHGNDIIDGGTMNSSDIQKAIIFYDTGERPVGIDNPSFSVIERADSICIVRYSLIAKFTNSLLSSLIPYPWIAIVILCTAVYIALVIIYSRRSSLCLNEELGKVLSATTNIENQDLDYMSVTNQFNELQTISDALDRMRAALKLSIQKQISVEQTKTEQISALAHDIKIPITIIQGNSELLSLMNLGKQETECLADIHSAAAEIENYTCRLIEVSKLDTLIAIDKHKIQLKDFLDEIASEFMAYIRSYPGIEFSLETDTLNNEILIDSELLHRAIMNVLTNAVHHGGKAKNRIVISSKKQDHSNLLLEVYDEGKGFSDEDLKRGADLLYMQDSARSNGHYGIGLNFANQVVLLHDGTLTFKNTGQGACVQIVLPI